MNGFKYSMPHTLIRPAIAPIAIATAGWIEWSAIVPICMNM
jgi:hypothetical protein